MAGQALHCHHKTALGRPHFNGGAHPRVNQTLKLMRTQAKAAHVDRGTGRARVVFGRQSWIKGAPRLLRHHAAPHEPGGHKAAGCGVRLMRSILDKYICSSGTGAFKRLPSSTKIGNRNSYTRRRLSLLPLNPFFCFPLWYRPAWRWPLLASRGLADGQ